MRWVLLVIASAITLAGEVATGQTAERGSVTQPLTLAEAWRLAEDANGTLRAKQAQLAAARGASEEAAAWLAENPELALEGTRRSVPRPDLGPDRYSEWKAGISQAFEIAGQPALRRRAADAGLQSLNAEIADTRRQVRAEVAQHFYRLLGLQQRLDIEQQAVTLFETTAATVEKRRAAGEDTRLDANFAELEAERARAQLSVLAEQLLVARSELAARLQMPPDRLPEALPDAIEPPPPNLVLDRVLGAVEDQPRVRALAAKEESARARLDLERARRYPDITVGLSVGNEGPSDARERLTTLSVSVPLPLFKRNAAAIGQATTELAQAEVERETTTRNLRSEVHVLWARLRTLEERVRRMRTLVLPRLEENMRLSRKSRDAGEIGLLELIVINRQALDTRRELIEALTEYRNTRVALELAAGMNIGGVDP